MDSYGKKRKPNYSNYKPNQRSKSSHSLTQGMKGFICTCNFREKECIRESYNLLNEYADRIYGDKKQENASLSTETDDTEEDIQSSLTKEIATLKADGKKSRFQVLESGAKNCIFIKTTLEDPVDLVHHIVRDLEEQKKQKTRFLLRLLPIEATCSAYIDDIVVFATPLIEKYFRAEGKVFSILFNSRNNSGVSREKVIEVLAQLVLQQNPDNRVDLKQPQLSVLVEIIRGMCCISVLPDYYRYRRYNLLEITGVDAPTAGNKEEAASGTAEEETGETSSVSAKDRTGEPVSEPAGEKEDLSIAEGPQDTGAGDSKSKDV